MQASQTPTRVTLAFAANGTKNTIPAASQIGITPGAASLNDGFPPLTFTPIAAGGVPPAGADFNGILNLISQTTRWQNAGGMFGYNSAFATDANVGGYPRGALLLRADQSGAWLNQADSNTTNPDTGGAGWVPAFMSGCVGQVRNLLMSVPSASTTATLTADEIVVGTATGGQKYVLGSVNQTINLATTGAGGMDTGSAPTSGYVGVYVMYNPTTGARTLVAQNATSAALPSVYGGSNAPSGYTASALISAWATNASKQFKPGTQRDRKVSFALTTFLTTNTVAASATSLSISSVVPPNAVSVGGSMQCQTSVGSASTLAFIGADANMSGQAGVYSGASAGVSQVSNYEVDMAAAQTVYYVATNSAGTPTFTYSASSYRI